jgi:hypothetical protein
VNPLVSRERTELEKAIFAEDIKGALKMAFMKTVVPRLRDSALFAIHTMIDCCFTGNGRNNGTSSNGYINYNNTSKSNGLIEIIDYSKNRSTASIVSSKQGSASMSGSIVFDSEDQVEKFIDLMRKAIEDGGWVSVLTVYSWLGESVGHAWGNWGWSSVDGSKISRVSNGWELKLPRASQIVYD